jgi:hypothetical protein
MQLLSIVRSSRENKKDPFLIRLFFLNFEKKNNKNKNVKIFN